MRVYARIVPTRVIVNVIDREPARSRAADSPLISFRAKMRFSLPATEKTEPLWVEGQVQVNADRTLEMLWIAPQYGSVQGTMVNAILNVYRDAVLQAAEDSDLAILGVEP